MLIPLKKHVTSACYDKQQACAYLKPFYARQAIVKDRELDC